jgi:hypothetical protein
LVFVLPLPYDFDFEDVEKKAINTLTDAIRTRAARRQMEAAATLKPFYIAANKTGQKLTEIGQKQK